MTRTVKIEEAEGHLAELVESIGENDEVILEKGGRPVAKLAPIPAAKSDQDLPPRTVGDFRGQFWMADDFNEPLPDELWGFDKPLDPS